MMGCAKVKEWLGRTSSLPWIFGSLFLGLHALAKAGDDWPNWLGPRYNGMTSLEGLRIPSDGEEYPTLWTAAVGTGWSAPVVEGDFLYLHDREGA